MPDAVDRLDHVSHAYRVQPPPGAGGEDAGVDLEVQMPVRVAGPRRVMPDHRGLDPLDRHLHLPPARSDAGGRVLGDPADDLGGSFVLGFVQRLRYLGIQSGGQRPGLRPVDDHLDEPQRIRVIADPTLLATGVNIDPGNPLLVGLTVHRARVLDPARGRCEAGSHSAALAEVVVVRPGAIPLDVGARGLRRAAVELHPAIHPDHRLHDVRRQPTDP